MFVSNHVILIPLTCTEGACYTLDSMLGVIHVSQGHKKVSVLIKKLLLPFPGERMEHSSSFFSFFLDLSSPTRNEICAPFSGSMES